MKWTKSFLPAVAVSAAFAFAALPPASAAETLKVGADPDFKPISFADPSGKLIGFDPDFAASLAEHMGATLDYQGVAWDGILPALQGGKIDAITNMVVTDKRKEVASFSQPILAQAITTVVRKDEANLNPKLDDLKSMKVGVMVNTAAAGVVAKLAGADVTTYNTVADEYQDLILGRIDVVAIESVNGSYTAKATYPDKLRVTGVPLTPDAQKIAVAMRLGDKDLVAKVDHAIDAMRADGSLDKIAVKWFGDTKIVARP
ncbi:ABC transporter substrate-binding protein [Labrys monachus]|uniref:ABC-type amino acid transport substrate-binding protein n=1 Tax=Labrys monachus TaxID=217067 RepID=A0ABU0FEE6_9HYPH|nr:ABC transporter substrate-binding protein [Labrys monachus]MDQ0392806.1 ABC-type amino acid transport substrate-binding protein [Labrys monachus]